MYNYIITTDDIAAGIRKIDEIRQSLNMELDESSYDLEDDSIYSIIDELSTVSLFDTTKFIVVKQAEAVCKITDKALRELCSIMNNINSNNVLILFISNSFDFKNENYNKIKRYATTIDIKLKNIAIDEYIKDSFKKEGFQIDNQALSLMTTYIENMTQAATYIDLLIAYKFNEKIITVDDINLMISKPLEDNVYQLVEAVLENNKKRIFSCYNDLKTINVQPSYIVSMLINKFQEIFNVYTLLKGGMSQADIADLFNVSSGRAYYMVKNAKKTNMNDIKNNLSYLNDLEYGIKSGKIDQTLGLELYFLR